MSAISEYKKLREALNTIKEECRGHGNACCGCPFEVDYKCGITGERTGSGDYRRKPQYWITPEIKLLQKPKED